ncbi:MAG TPA: type IV pilus assembly protein PilM [Terriglobia bacterium]|nr:type IV pilus assembly protein PilM [Terriglobia bacterium]
MFASLRKKPTGLVGLDIGSSSVKAVELRQKSDGYELVSLALDRLSQDTIVDGAIMDSLSVSAAIEKIFSENKITSARVATSVSGNAVIVKRLTVNAATQEELEAAVQREATQSIRFDLGEVNINYYVLGPAATGTGLDVLLLAVKREKMQSHANVLSQANKTPVVLDIDAFALQNAFELSYDPPPDQTIALLNIGASIMNINITRGGMPLFTRDVSVGGNQYTDILQKELNLSFDDAEKLKMGQPLAQVPPDSEAPHLRSISELLLLEIQKTFDYFRHTTSSDPIQAIYLAGGTARVKGLPDLLKAEFSVPVEIIDPFRKIHVNPGKFDPSFVSDAAPRMTIAVGLALRGFDAA